MSLLSMNQLSFRYFGNQRDSRIILKDLNLQVQKAEFVSIVGPSGCGKSTLLRLVAGLLAPSSGDLTIDPRTQEQIGFVFQEPRLLPWLNLSENLLWGLSDEKRENATQVLPDILSILKLSAKENYFPEQLSGGMKMRASLGRALIRDPELLLLDEPFSALDENTKLELQLELLKIFSHKKRTSLLVTHSLTEAVLLSDRVLIMNSSGELVQELKVEKAREQRFEWYRQTDFLQVVNQLREVFQRVNS